MGADRIDIELDAYLGLNVPDTTREEPDYAPDKFFGDAQLGAALGRNGDRIVSALTEETQDFHARAERILKHAAPARSEIATGLRKL